MATTTQTRSDNNIRDDVLLELKWDPKISSASDLAVGVRDGVVTLSGFVPSFWEKDAAEKAVKRVYGVKGIANDIEVKLFWQRTDPEIARDAVHELDSHISIPSDRIKVTVKNGWVTLEGTVDWEYQKNLAKSAVKKLKGVPVVTRVDSDQRCRVFFELARPQEIRSPTSGHSRLDYA
jgi:osmotically-inducible protein OsmY